MREQITHFMAALLASAAFLWRWESPQKRWTFERIFLLLAAAATALWNLYVALTPSSVLSPTPNSKTGPSLPVPSGGYAITVPTRSYLCRTRGGVY